MKLAELRAAAKIMKEYGLTHVKTNAFELSRSGDAPTDTALSVQPRPTRNPDAPTPEPDLIKHKVEQLTSIMKLSDSELVDRLFPDQVEEEQKEAS